MGPLMRLDDLHIDHVSHDRVVGEMLLRLSISRGASNIGYRSAHAAW